jgi:ubiquinone/menaquinone biosynthesis C-methylase UbiE
MSYIENTIIQNPDDYYKHARRKKKWSEGNIKKAFDIMNEHLSGSLSKEVLEVGCGMADAIDHFTQSIRFTGLDPTPICRMENEKRFPEHKFIEGVAEKMDLKNDTFDVIFSSQTLEMFYDPKAGLLEMIRVLRPGGLLVTLSPNLENPRARINAIRHYSPWQRFAFTFKRLSDLAKRFFGVSTFRTIDQNVLQKGSRYEQADDDLKYIVSAYEVSKFLSEQGLREIYALKAGDNAQGVKRAILKSFSILPPFRYYGGGLFMVHRKPIT